MFIFMFPLKNLATLTDLASIIHDTTWKTHPDATKLTQQNYTHPDINQLSAYQNTNKTYRIIPNIADFT